MHTATVMSVSGAVALEDGSWIQTLNLYWGGGKAKPDSPGSAGTPQHPQSWGNFSTCSNINGRVPAVKKAPFCNSPCGCPEPVLASKLSVFTQYSKPTRIAGLDADLSAGFNRRAPCCASLHNMEAARSDRQRQVRSFFSLSSFHLKEIVYQDRLGTNIPKAK